MDGLLAGFMGRFWTKKIEVFTLDSICHVVMQPLAIIVEFFLSNHYFKSYFIYINQLMVTINGFVMDIKNLRNIGPHHDVVLQIKQILQDCSENALLPTLNFPSINSEGTNKRVLLSLFSSSYLGIEDNRSCMLILISFY